ncbi:hypothetical protein IAT38_001735 [Cryptococcus sp. DSM 104549]
MPPSLLYHSSEPALYPTNTSSSLVVIRFASSVRISSVRVTPEGVRSVSGPGVTYPSRWSGQILFNISPSNPVNALVTTSIDVNPANHALDFAIDMPVGITTRMMMLRAPVERLTISVYGYSGTDPSDDAPSAQTAASSSLPQETPADTDWTWLWSWAGPSHADLLPLLSPNTPSSTSLRAIECLDLLYQRSDGEITSLLVGEPVALDFVMSQPSELRERLLSNPEWAVREPLSRYIPEGHPLWPLVSVEEGGRRKAAWENLEVGEAALRILQGRASEAELLRVEKGSERSNLSRLVGLAQGYAQGGEAGCLWMMLGLLAPANGVHDPLVAGYLARTLPRLVSIYNTLAPSPEAQRTLDLPAAYAREIVGALLQASTEVAGGKLAWDAAANLAKGYLVELDNSDPLRTAFTSTPSTVIPAFSDDTSGRAIARLVSALSASHPLAPSNTTAASHPTSHQHLPLSSSLITLLAPQLALTLSTAPLPPFGIAPSAEYAPPEGAQGANAWAGKVYSSHEFRSRERETVGLGIQVAGISRPASKHVDEYA